MERVSLKDIAKTAGASIASVSFILNGKAREMRISVALEKKVRSIADAAGYTPNKAAVSLRTGRSKMIGLIVESISGHFFGTLAKTVEEEAEKFGYKIIYSSTENKAQRGIDILKMFSQQQIDGYLITPAKGMEAGILSIAKHHKPLVLIDSYFANNSISYVLVDNYRGIMMGMQHLFEKGYSKIGLITVNLSLVQMEERKKAFKDALTEKKLKKEQPILEVIYGRPREEQLQQIGQFIDDHPLLEALFFATNYLGLLGLEHIQKRQLKMPEDIAMICFDDDDVFRLFPGGITAIRQPVVEIATKAISLLIKQLLNKKNQKGIHEQVKIAPQLILRGST